MHNFKLFLRSLKKRKTLSIITIAGYAISMAVLIILISFIYGENSINGNFDNKNNIYRIVRSKNISTIPSTLYKDVIEKIPGIDKMCMYSIQDLSFRKDKILNKASFIATNDDFIEMFSFKFIYQSANPTLSNKENIILTKSFSQRLFGDENPVGRTLDINTRICNVVGVVTDLPENSSFRFDAFINRSLGSMSLISNADGENHWMTNSFVLLNPKADIETVKNQISGKLDHWKAFNNEKLSLEPLDKVYFNGLADDQLLHGNVKLIYLLSSIAVIILLMTVFNYVNLTVSQGYERIKEIGIKKTTGAGRHDIFRQMLSESVLVSLISMVFALVLVSFFSSLFTEIVGKEIGMSTLIDQPLIIIFIIIFFLFIGILSGIYPALAFSNFSPLETIGYNGFRRVEARVGIIAVQFFITSVLIISLLFIQKQLGFVKHKDPGFDRDMLVTVDLTGNSGSKWQVMKDELLKFPQIISVSASNGGPLQVLGWSTVKYNLSGEQQDYKVGMISVDEDFVETFGLNLIKGENLNEFDTNVSLINKHYYNILERDNLTDYTFDGAKIAGVVDDFQFQDLYTEIGNVELRKTNMINASKLNIRLNGDVSETIDIIKEEYEKFEAEMPFTFRFYDDWLQSLYDREEKQAKTIKVFALFAIIISCLGLIGLIEHITNKKIKEIGIRKINGAKISEIVAMLNSTVIQWVLAGFIIAVPTSYYIMNKWLESFAYKTELSWWVFALAGLLALGIALLTVGWQSWRAATRNPVEALRYE